MTSQGQTPYPISTILNRVPEGTIGDMLTENEDAALNIVGCRMVTDRQTDRHTHTYTHRQTHRNTHTRTETHTHYIMYMRTCSFQSYKNPALMGRHVHIKTYLHVYIQGWDLLT